MLWELVEGITGKCPCKRNDHSATLWGKDKLVIFGGSDETGSPLCDVHILNLSTLSWSQPLINSQNWHPTKRARHSAVVYNSILYITGGCVNDGDPTCSMDMLDMRTMTWLEAVDFEVRTSHTSFVYRNRLYIWGGLLDSCERTVDLSFIDLTDFTVTHVKIDNPNTPLPFGQHFAQRYGNRMCLLITDHLANSANPTGVWSLELDSMVWHKHDDGAFLDSGTWHYLADSASYDELPSADPDDFWWDSIDSTQMQGVIQRISTDAVVPAAPPRGASCARMVLFGAEDNTSDEYVGKCLVVDLETYGIFHIPGVYTMGDNDNESGFSSNMSGGPNSLISDISALFSNHSELCDFKLQSSLNPPTPPIPVHKLILMARWAHFASLTQSGMADANIDTLSLPEHLDTLRGLVQYIYTDSIAGIHIELMADLMVLANMYCLDRLQKLCAAKLCKLQLTVETAAQSFEIATKVGDEGLIKMAVKFISENFG
ncbi:hypothetical protein HK096_005885, partial [Nowakowskiella sp. JEL0078]